MSTVSNRYILIQAYRTIRVNKGTMTPASPMPKAEYDKLNETDKELANKLLALPD